MIKQPLPLLLLLRHRHWSSSSHNNNRVVERSSYKQHRVSELSRREDRLKLPLSSLRMRYLACYVWLREMIHWQHSLLLELSRQSFDIQPMLGPSCMRYVSDISNYRYHQRYHQRPALLIARLGSYQSARP